MANKYNDTTAVINVISNVYNNPSLLDITDQYVITDDDFAFEFHKIIFGSIYHLHEMGINQISIEAIEDFLENRPKSQGVYLAEKGRQWLMQVAEVGNIATFNYYYQRLKKMTLLRAYDKYGVDVSDIYDSENILDIKKKQRQEDFLDNSSLEDIANLIDSKIDAIKIKYLSDNGQDAYQAGEGIFELLDRFKQYPEVGVPLYGSLVNTVTRGARLGKFYLRSAPTGVGKTRSLIADTCYIGANEIYDEQFGWIKNGVTNPTLYITTEQTLDEIQTMMMAFLSNVNEDCILNGKYNSPEEEERVYYAAQVIKNSPIYVEELPDFSLQDIENKIKKNLREHDIKYVAYDYIHTSIKILEEITRRSGGVKLREDNILFMLSTRIKDICKHYDVFIFSATQLNTDYQDSKTPDQNLLRGAKSIADKIDVGMIILPVTEQDKQSLESLCGMNGFPTPKLKISIYKNRRGKYKGVLLWCESDLGTCRIEPIFCTDYAYQLIDIPNLKIIMEDEESAF